MSKHRSLALQETASPRVEIHLHLEGTISLPRLLTFWDRPGRDPSLPSDPTCLYRHRSFPEFLHHFAQITRLLNRSSLGILSCQRENLRDAFGDLRGGTVFAGIPNENQ